jgi:hypothetical protein
MQSTVDEIVGTSEPAADQERVGNVPPHALAGAVQLYGPQVVLMLRDYLVLRGQMECAETSFEASPDPSEQDAERCASAQVAVLDCIAPFASEADRERLDRAKRDYRENMRARLVAKRTERAALQATQQARVLRALATLSRRARATPRARQQRRNRQSPVRLARPAGRKKRHRSSGDDGPGLRPSHRRHHERLHRQRWCAMSGGERRRALRVRQPGDGARPADYKPWPFPSPHLIGHATVDFSDWMVAKIIPVFQRGDGALSVSGPSAPKISREGRQRERDGNGVYAPVITCATSDACERWQRVVLAGLAEAGIAP